VSKYKVVFADGDILRDGDGDTEFSLQRAGYFFDRLIEYADVRIVPTRRYCRWCHAYHPYMQDGCHAWPPFDIPPHQHIVNLGVGHKQTIAIDPGIS
jgi:hypothetical protein